MYAPLYDEDVDRPSVTGLTPTGWWAEARCNDGAGSLSGLFFSEELQDIARAKAICLQCPVIAECLEGALERREPWGVWGGQLFLNGRVLANKRRRGRPPKVPRPEDELPEVPVPVHLLDQLRTA
jgi:WhiB family transcriptional regulator, redox-sensing transcriptional regulator